MHFLTSNWRHTYLRQLSCWEILFDGTINLWAFYRPNSISRYVILYKDASSNERELRDYTKKQTRVLRDLKTYTKYTITVYAEDRAGLKGASAVTEATTNGGGS